MIKFRKIIIAFVLFLPSVALSGWVDKQGNRMPESDYMKSAGDLIAQLIITDNEAQVFKNWETPSDSVYFSTTDKIERNKIITAFIVFGGCAVDMNGNCDLRMQITVYQPDGSIYSKLPPMEIWSNKPVPPNINLGLSVDYLRVMIENGEPLGKYKVEAKIMDRISNTCLLLSSYFIATEEKK